MSGKKTSNPKPPSQADSESSSMFAGIVNPSGLGTSIAGLFYVAFVPVTSYFARTESIKTLAPTLASYLVPGFSSSSSPSATRLIPALATIYIYWAFCGSGALSVAGQAMSRKEGLDNDNPRLHLNNMTGFPLRMKSAHNNLMEQFAPWALAAGLAQVLAPGDEEVTALLAYSMAAKLFVFYPAYLFGFSALRSTAHLNANAAVVNVIWRLATGAATA